MGEETGRQEARDVPLEGFLALGREAFLMGEKDETERLFEQYLKSGEVGPHKELELAKTWLLLGEEEKALEHLFWCINQDVEFWEAYFHLGKVSLNRGLDQDALNFFEHVIELRPDHRESWEEIGKLLKKHGEEEMGEKALQKALEL